MANNCLVTKLKSTVDNEALLKLGELKIEFNPGQSVTYAEEHYIRFRSTSSMELASNKDMLGPSQANWGRSKVIAANSDAYVHTIEQGQYLKISDKYALSLIEMLNIDCEFDVTELNYMPHLIGFNVMRSNTIEIPKLHGVFDVSVCKDANILPYCHGCTNIGEFEGSSLIIYGDVDAADVAAIPSNVKNIRVIVDNVDIQNLAGVSSLESLYVGNCHSCTGNINGFGSIPAFINFFGGTFDCTFSGSIEQFVANKRAAGVTESPSEVTFNWVSGNVTFNGSNIPFAANLKLSWTATTITFNGVTINA